MYVQVELIANCVSAGGAGPDLASERAGEGLRATRRQRQAQS